MEVSIKEDFGGIGMWSYRDDLTKHLDCVQGHLDWGLWYFQQYEPWIQECDIQLRKKQYRPLKSALLEVEKATVKTLTETHSTFACALPLLCL